MAVVLNRIIWIGASSMLFFSQERLTQRQLSDIGTVAVPARLKSPSGAPFAEEFDSRLTFRFASTYFWASFGGRTAYKQLLIISVMAPDATEQEYAQRPHALNLGYERRTSRGSMPLGTGTVTVTDGVYEQGGLHEPAVEYVYIDRQKRLHIAWHAVKNEIDTTRALSVLADMAASFRLTRDTRSTFATMRAAPGEAAALRVRRIEMTRRMLEREGYPELTAGQPILRNGVYLEWMDEPEARYQLLVPLGRIRRPDTGSMPGHPRPILRDEGTADDQLIARSIGWREYRDGEWTFMTTRSSYLPMTGIAAALSSQQQDPGFIYFYYAALVRIEEEENDGRRSSLRWFLDQVPTVQRRWQAGTLITPATGVRH